MDMFEIWVSPSFEGHIYNEFKISLPIVPRIGDTIFLPSDLLENTDKYCSEHLLRNLKKNHPYMNTEELFDYLIESIFVVDDVFLYSNENNIKISITDEEYETGK